MHALWRSHEQTSLGAVAVSASNSASNCWRSALVSKLLHAPAKDAPFRIAAVRRTEWSPHGSADCRETVSNHLHLGLARRSPLWDNPPRSLRIIGSDLSPITREGRNKRWPIR